MTESGRTAPKASPARRGAAKAADGAAPKPARAPRPGAPAAKAAPGIPAAKAAPGIPAAKAAPGIPTAKASPGNPEARPGAAETPAFIPHRPDLGLRPLGNLIPRLTKPAFKRRSPAGALLMAEWPQVVGPAIAAVTTPRRLTNGTLTIACSGPMAMELQHLAPQLIQRINASTGALTVQALRFVQSAPAGPAAPRRPAPAVPLPGRVEGALQSLPEGGLREALARLARGVYRNP